MAVPLFAAKVALNAAIPFFKKHPWVIPVSSIGGILVIILIFSFVFGAANGLSNIKVFNKACENSDIFPADKYPDGVRDLNLDEISSQVENCDGAGFAGVGNWTLPSNGSISSFYGPRDIVCGGTGCSVSKHMGLDFSAACGTPVLATSSGTVTSAGNAGSFGQRIIIDHNNGFETRYGHLSAGSILVKTGETVTVGQQIGSIGKTGVATGCHLDLKIFVEGVDSDPLLVLLAQGVNVVNLNGVLIDWVRSIGPISTATMNSYCNQEAGKQFYYCPGGLPRDQTPPIPTGPIVTPNGVAGAQAYAKQALTKRGMGDSEYGCLVNLWSKESGWRVDANNKSSGAYGIPQALPGTKMATVGADWKTNPATQIEWGLNYITGRYATPCAAWAHSQAKNWY